MNENSNFLECPKCGEKNWSLLKAKHSIYDCDCGNQYWIFDNEIISKE